MVPMPSVSKQLSCPGCYCAKLEAGTVSEREK